MGANTAGLCISFLSECLQAFHNFGTTNTRAGTGADTFKAALYYQNESLGPATTAYSSSGEVSGTGYTAGGAAVANGVAPAISGLTAYWTPSASISWNGLTISSAFDSWLLYNASQNNRAVLVATFPAQTIAAGTFTISQPTNAAGSALINFVG